MLFSGRYKTFPVLFLVASLLYLPGAFAAEAPDAESGSQRGLILDEETQRRLGLQTTELQASHYRPEFIAYGIVQDMQPLLELRNRYFAAQAAKSISAARLQQAQKNLARLNALYREDIISQSKLQTQQMQWQADIAQAGADREQIDAIRNSAELQWGKKLADWALSEASPHALTPNYKLLLITLPPERSLPEPPGAVHIHRSSDRAHATTASFVSAAPQTSGVFQGETYFFSSTDDRLRIGMRVTAWVAQQQGGLEGVMIPASAVVWHLGQAFAYLQTDDERFERRAVDVSLPAASGYFVPRQFSAGEKLVTTGAQMLLSEEFRTQIPGEDDD